MSVGVEYFRKRTPCSYQPTAATPSFASNQCDEQFTVTGAFESTAPPVNMPFSSVSHVSCGTIAPLDRPARRHVSNLPWPRQPPGGTSSVSMYSSSVISSVFPRRCELWRMKSLYGDGLTPGLPVVASNLGLSGSCVNRYPAAPPPPTFQTFPALSRSVSWLTLKASLFDAADSNLPSERGALGFL